MIDVSVVIPCYNAENKIGQTLESVLNQIHLAAQIIVVDDGSTDDSRYIVSKFPKVTCLSQENKGPAAARNKGVSLASSDWIAFCDSDDVWLPNKLMKQWEWLWPL